MSTTCRYTGQHGTCQRTSKPLVLTHTSTHIDTAHQHTCPHTGHSSLHLSSITRSGGRTPMTAECTSCLTNILEQGCWELKVTKRCLVERSPNAIPQICPGVWASAIGHALRRKIRRSGNFYAHSSNDMTPRNPAWALLQVHHMPIHLSVHLSVHMFICHVLVQRSMLVLVHMSIGAQVDAVLVSAHICMHVSTHLDIRLDSARLMCVNTNVNTHVNTHATPDTAQSMLCRASD